MFNFPVTLRQAKLPDDNAQLKTLKIQLIIIKSQIYLNIIKYQYRSDLVNQCAGKV